MQSIIGYDIQQLSAYFSGLSDGRLVAVNVFGEPFFDVLGVLIKVSPETGDREEVGLVSKCPFDKLDDYWTGASLKEVWEHANGPVGNQHFLVPITPFALGGEFVISNLARLPIQEALALYQLIREQISDLSDGAKVSIEE